MPTYALKIAYDGGDFAGFWRQPGRRTVGSELDAACVRIGEHGAQAEPASRTDAGVHARDQIVRLCTARSWSPRDLASTIDCHLPSDCACLAAAEVPDDWHPSVAASTKTYRYRLDVGDQRNPFLARTSWRLGSPINPTTLTTLNELAATLSGPIDCRAFARRGDYRDHHLTRFSNCVWNHHDPELACLITADRFGLHLVRCLVGAMVAVATGRGDSAQWQAALAGEEQPICRQVAPARGLCLDSVQIPTPLDWQPAHR